MVSHLLSAQSFSSHILIKEATALFPLLEAVIVILSSVES
jgi:hypothetical protein